MILTIILNNNNIAVKYLMMSVSIIEQRAIFEKRLTSEVATEINAYDLFKEMKEDTLSTAIFRGMEKSHLEVLLGQAHLEQSTPVGWAEGGYDSRYRFDDDYAGFHNYREPSLDTGNTKESAEVLQIGFAATPPLLVPKLIEIDIYVVKMQNSYYPLGE